MNFQGKGSPLNDEGMDFICSTLGIYEPEAWAVLKVETKGFGFLKDRRPRILFERHIFHKITNGNYDNGHADISNAKAGGYLGDESEYPRLQKAIKLDANAALQSASWGIGQVMGFNYEVAGFKSIDEMVTSMVQDENSQIQAVANFIKANGLAGALQRQNWVSFARGYNGGDFKKNDYDTRLAAAYANYKVSLPDLSLRAAQAALTYLNFNPGPVDGLRGRMTRSALMQFQGQFGLPETGDLDQDTEDKLVAEAFPT